MLPGIDVNNHNALVIFHIFIRLSAKSFWSKSNYALQLITADLHLQITLKLNNDASLVLIQALLSFGVFVFLFFLSQPVAAELLA